MAKAPVPRSGGARQSASPLKQVAGSYLDHHRTVARDSIVRMWRNPVSSMMTWAVMGVALALPVALLLLLASLQNVSAGWENGARVTVYLGLETPLPQANALADQIDTDSRVAFVELVDRERALAEFRVSSGLADALDFLQENPLPHSLLITPEASYRSTDGVEALVEYLQGLPAVERVQVDLGWLQRLNALAGLLTRAALALAILLAVAVVLVIGNTVRLAIESRRDEILVAKLVGGTDAFVRRPFLYTGAWFGLGGGLVAWLLLLITFWWLSAPVARLAALYHSDFVLSGLGFENAIMLIFTAMTLGWLGAWVAVRRHLDDMEPGDH
ncbi:permease-like cell division protein FtsX [Marinobacter sp. ELB17]|uniref:permease-like cell division protein FtsX n=1 Tax=Marinobacter sp. ELB17 TaxID=270374 RepID=UPI0000F36D3E|nr:permease-like cell division protein FtsX [Marinobacter sp. ELB17]EBA01481.1 Cell division protein [Marinobacter sp. ELB17]